jgi:hypothetical protein
MNLENKEAKRIKILSSLEKEFFLKEKGRKIVCKQCLKRALDKGA